MIGLSFRELDNAFDKVSSDLVRTVGSPAPNPSSTASFVLPTSITSPLIDFPSAPFGTQSAFTTSIKQRLPQQSLNASLTPLIALLFVLWSANYLQPGAKNLWYKELSEEWLNCEDDSASEWVDKAEVLTRQLLREYGTRTPDGPKG